MDEILRLNLLDPFPDGRKPVLLLHGLGADASSWEYQIPALGTKGFRPVAVDLPGFGKTPKPASGWSIHDSAVAASRMMNELVDLPYDVVGISMGGVVAQVLARLDLGRVRKLVLVNTFACLRPRRVNEWFYLLKRIVVANFRGVKYQAEAVAERLFPELHQAVLREEIIRRILDSDPIVYRTAMWQLARFDSTRWLKEIGCPTLVISGELDSTVPLDNQKELANGLPTAHQVIIPAARHGVIVDQPEKFNQALLEFLEQ